MAISSFETISKSLDIFPILGLSFSENDFVALDLSVDNKSLKKINVSSSNDLYVFIWKHIKTNNAKVAYGGYLEKRNIYNRSNHFNKQNSETERNIHLGVDLWIDANTPIYSPLDAKIHSFRDNNNYGDYGPTLILEHEIKGLMFYTLYGHLSLESLNEKHHNQIIKKGQQIATIGTADVNGDYPPHLHFQIIFDLEEQTGDFPGVSSKVNLGYYEINCPNPMLLIKYLNN